MLPLYTLSVTVYSQGTVTHLMNDLRNVRSNDKEDIPGPLPYPSPVLE